MGDKVEGALAEDPTKSCFFGPLGQDFEFGVQRFQVCSCARFVLRYDITVPEVSKCMSGLPKLTW